jgi:diacylglycerol kinase (ATP)
VLAQQGTHAQPLPTEGPGTAADMARKCISDGADLILVAGGDGTVNEVANGMIFSSVPLGVIPAGTANVLAMELGVGRRAERAARALGDCVPVRVSVGVVLNEADRRPRHFLLMAGAGLDAHIVYNINVGMKNAFGKVAYWISGFGQIGRRLPAFDVDVEGERFRCSFALASRVRNYGGDLEIARGVSLLEHHFELVLFEGNTTFPYLKYFLGVLTHRLDRMKGVTILQTKAARFTSPSDNRIYVQVDGEFAGWLPSTIAIVPHAITLLVPPTYHARERSMVREHVWTPSPSS